MSKAQDIGGPSDGYSIGEAARASGLTPKTIRYYEEISLIPKAARRNTENAPHTGGDRIYGETDVARLRFIHQARLLDLSLDDIRELVRISEQVGCPSEDPTYGEILKGHLLTIDERIDHLSELRAAVQSLLDRRRPVEVESCTPTTCECMQPDTT